MTTATHAAGMPYLAGRARWGAAERNFWRGAALTAVLVLVFQVVYWIERDWLGRPHEARFVYNGSETAMRYLTIPHIVIGFLFSVTSVRNRSAGRRGLIAVLLLCGAALCMVYNRYYDSSQQVTAVAVYAYFLVHELRDESFFYVLLGDAPANMDKARFAGLARGLSALTITALGVLAWPAIVYGFVHKASAIVPDGLNAAGRAALAAGPLIVWLACASLFLRSRSREFAGGVGELVRTHAPLMRLIAGVMLVLGVGMLIARRPYAIILLHVMVWYVFTLRNLKNRPPAQPVRGVWSWMRTTPLGFNVLHMGMALLLIGVGAVWMYGLGGGGWLWYVLSPEVFLYWTIMHITVSFVPR